MRKIRRWSRESIRLRRLITLIFSSIIAPSMASAAPSAPDTSHHRPVFQIRGKEQERSDTMSYKIDVDVLIMSRYLDSLQVVGESKDSVSNRVFLRLTNRSATSWSGQVDSYDRIAGPSREIVSSVPGNFPIPVSFSLASPGESWTRTTPAEGSCSVDAAIAAVAREVVFTAPRRLDIGVTWQDSSVVPTCRDSIPLEVISVRRYRVVQSGVSADPNLVAVERTTTTRLRGTGRQFGESVTITGRGSGTMRFTLARTDGSIVTGEGEQTLDLQLDGRRRTQEVRQTTQITVQRFDQPPTPH